jgi:hypothetical protein
MVGILTPKKNIATYTISAITTSNIRIVTITSRDIINPFRILKVCRKLDNNQKII